MNSKPPNDHDQHDLDQHSKNDANDPSALRKIYFDAWQKHLKGMPLVPMELMIVDLIQHHPEYHPLFATPENYQMFEQEKFALDHNPFFHLGLHLAIKEQAMTDRPPGIRSLYQQLCARYGSELEAEHRILPCLTRLLTEQFNPADPQSNDAIYLDDIRKMLN